MDELDNILDNIEFPAIESLTAVAIAWITFSIILYMLPTIIAILRRHKNIASLSVINVFFGWTLLAYVVCLAWSFSYQEPRRRSYRRP
jgi:hypothetical protein